MNTITEPWNENVIEEKNNVQRKYIKLIDYINSEEFHKLSDNQQKLLNNQKVIIEAYLKTLSTRLYDDVDNITIVDYSWLGLMMGVFTSKPLFNVPSNTCQS